MDRALVPAATSAALAMASRAGLAADSAEMLQDSNRLVLRLRPCDVVARVASEGARLAAGFEVDVARQLKAARAPVALPDPRVAPAPQTADGFVATFWMYYEPVEPRAVPAAAYASALANLHRAMRSTDIPAPRFTERVVMAQTLAVNKELVPALVDQDRALICDALEESVKRAMGGAREQLLHGEPHSDNLLRTRDGLLFTDFETCCRGPVEFDLADVPEDAAAHYPEVDAHLLHVCRVLVLAMVATWCWAGYDQHENLRRAAPELLAELRVALAGSGF